MGLETARKYKQNGNQLSFDTDLGFPIINKIISKLVFFQFETWRTQLKSLALEDGP